MGREAAENSQERKRRHADISEQQAPAPPTSSLPEKGPNLPGKKLSSICSRAPSIPGGYACTPARDSIKAPVCSIPSWRSFQHCESFPVHLSPRGCWPPQGRLSQQRGFRLPQRRGASARGKVTSPQRLLAQRQHLQSPCEKQRLEPGRQLQEWAKRREYFGCSHLLRKCTGCS